jgi:hypothetical protein
LESFAGVEPEVAWVAGVEIESGGGRGALGELFDGGMEEAGEGAVDEY